MSVSFALFLLAAIEVTDRCTVALTDHLPVFLRTGVLLLSILPGSLLFAGLAYARKTPLRSTPVLWLGLLVAALVFPASMFFLSIDDFFYSPDFAEEYLVFLGNAGSWFYAGVMLYCILALVNIEAAFSSITGSSDRWRIKFEVVGISAIIAMLILYFSQGLLYRTINMNLLPLRSAVFIIGSLLIVYSRRVRGTGVRVTVSRYIFYRSLTLLIVGAYLILLSLIGEGMKYFDFGRNITMFFGFVLGILLFILILSEQLRRRAKVFINKHFFAHKRDYREEWLRFTGRLASCKTLDDVYEATLNTFKEDFGLEGVSLYVSDTGGSLFRPALSMAMPAFSRGLLISEALHAYFVDRGRVLNPGDREYDPVEREAEFIRETDASLLVPLIRGDSIEGLVVFGKQLAKEKLIYEDFDLMKTLARQAALSITNFRLARQLVEAGEAAALGKISSFVIHDMKNLTYTLSLTLDNAEEHIANPDFQSDLLATMKKTLSKMGLLIQKLKAIPDKPQLLKEPADILLLARESIEEIIATNPNAGIVVQGTTVFSLVDREEIKKVIINLVINALDAVDENGRIVIETGCQMQMNFISVSDNGPGVPEEFIRDHLFKPFRTTKKNGLGIGLYQSRQIVEAHGGKITAECLPGKGTVFIVQLHPLEKKRADGI